MGAGRRTETVHYSGHSLVAGSNNIKSAPQRKLGERNRLGAVIFGCTNATYNECVTNKLFGLPYSHHTYVEHISGGMPLFLFNYTERKMHGIFEATSDGQLNINPYAWAGSDWARTQYPAQVRVQLRPDFSRIVSVAESVFRETLIDSYHSPNHFFFEVDIEQTDRLIKLFERAAGNSYRSTVSKNQANAWQITTPSKVWKKTNGSLESEEMLKLKTPATIIMSEWEKGAQYFPSSSKEIHEPYHQQSVWTRQSDTGVDYSSDESEDFQETYRIVPSEVEMSPVLRNEKAEQDRGTQGKFASGYSPKSNGTGEAPVSTLEEGDNSASDRSNQTLTASQEEESRRVHERLKHITNVPRETQTQQTLISQAGSQMNGEIVLGNLSREIADLEKSVRDRCIEEQDLPRKERNNLSVSLSDFDSSVEMTVKKNLELHSSAIAQMRQDGMEVRRLLDEARVRPEELERLTGIENSNASMALEIQNLKLEVMDLQRQLENFKAVIHDKTGVHENVRSRMITGEPHDHVTPPDIYLIGGLGDQLSRLESVMIWSPGTDQLQTAASMLTPRCCAGACVLDDHIYVFGGGDGTYWYNTVERYDRREDQWRSCAPMKTKRGSLGGVTVIDQIYAVGGGNGQVSFSEVESYDPHLGVWLPCTSMFEKRFCVAATEFGGALYALGGFDGEQYLTSVERYDPREALWTRMPSMHVKRGSLSAAVLNGKIYALGGYDGDCILDVVETFDPRASRWDMGLQMCCQRAYGAVAVVGESLYYMGGLAEDEAVDSDGYRSWRSQRQASWQQYILGSSFPGLNISSSYQIQRFTEATGWQSMRPQVIGKRSCLAAAVL